ncbi:MAG: hypothetical protein ACR2H1_02525, partial [Limisphaerales bacterium]
MTPISYKTLAALGLALFFVLPADAATRRRGAVAIRDNSRIALITYHVSGISDPASTARQNIVDCAGYGPSKTSGYSDVGVTEDWLNTSMLDCMAALANTYGYTYTVTELMG